MAHILLMEDDTPFGLEIASALRAASHEVVLTGSATDARRALWHWDFDILITDMVVRQDERPVPDGGLGLISWVRHTAITNPGLPYLPVIAISGEDARRGMSFLLPTADRVGADIVMEKPIDMTTLLSNIGALTTGMRPESDRSTTEVSAGAAGS